MKKRESFKCRVGWHRWNEIKVIFHHDEEGPSHTFVKVCADCNKRKEIRL